jgi:hypothetical protein
LAESSRYLDDDRRPLTRGALPEFAAHEGLGLVVYKGAASFRDVLLEPYDPNGGAPGANADP